MPLYSKLQPRLRRASCYATAAGWRLRILDCRVALANGDPLSDYQIITSELQGWQFQIDAILSGFCVSISVLGQSHPDADHSHAIMATALLAVSC